VSRDRDLRLPRWLQFGLASLPVGAA